MQSLTPEPLLSEEDYGAIEAAVMETARGRWFLAEFARRNRNADTQAVLSAIRRLERLVQSAGTFDARDDVTRGMADIALAIAAAQVSPPGGDAPAQATAEPPERMEAVIEPAPWKQDEGEAAVAAAAPEIPHADVSESSDYIESVRESLILEKLLPVVEAAPAGPSADAVAVEAEPVPAPAAPIPTAVPAATEAQAPFPIIELDEEATEALLTSDVPRQELILPTNHLAALRWHRDAVGEEGVLPDHHLDRWGTAPVRSDVLPGAPAAAPEHWAPAAVAAEMVAPAGPAGLVTFIDEEPADEEQSIFTAPLRLEPEDTADTEAAAEPPPAAAPPVRALAPRLTLGEIEAMPFAKKAVLFS